MDVTDLIIAQLTDPFRVALLIALVFTTLQTSAHTGRLLPLAIGVVFVAVLIATTTGADGGNRVAAIGIGILTNAAIVGVVLGLHAVWRRMAGPKSPSA